jgi:hypothetical protein
LSGAFLEEIRDTRVDIVSPIGVVGDEVKSVEIVGKIVNVAMINSPCPEQK